MRIVNAQMQSVHIMEFVKNVLNTIIKDYTHIAGRERLKEQ